MEEAALDGLLEAGARRPSRKLMDLHRRVEAEELRFEIAVILALGAQPVRSVDHRLLVQADRLVSVFFQGLNDRQERRRAIEARKGVVGGIHDLCAVADGFDDPADIVSVGVMAVIMDNQVGILVQDGFDQIADPLCRSEPAVVLDAQDYLRPGDIEDFPDLADVILIGVLFPC